MKTAATDAIANAWSAGAPAPSGTARERAHAAAYLGLQRMRGRPVGAFIRRLRSWELLEPEAFAAMSATRLSVALEYARRRVPLYGSGAWEEALRGRTAGEIGDWPVLERAVLKEHREELLARPRRPWSTWRHSSASTGEPIDVALNPEASAWSWAAEYRAHAWVGVPVGARTLMISNRQSPLLDWVRNRRVILTTEMMPERLAEAARCLVEWRPSLIWGMPSAVLQFARTVRSQYPDAPEHLVDIVKLGGEQVFEFQRDEITRQLGAPVFESYGATEVGAISSACREGRQHVFGGHVHLEVFHGSQPAPTGAFGDLVATSLTNRAMPIVRCRIGDRGRIAVDPCPCGLPHPVLDDLLGRSADVLLAADGRRVHGSELARQLSSVFDSTSPGALQQVLFQQEHESRWVVLVESRDGFDEEVSRRLEGSVRTLFGTECDVDVQRVSTLPREPSGKFRYYRRQAAHPT